jgi:hypothetical protein
MKAANFPRGILPWNLYQPERAFKGWREPPLGKETKQAKTDGTGVDGAWGLLVALTVGLFSLWLCLVLLGLIGLTNSAGQLLTSLGLRMVVAAGFALVICIVAFPLFVPWLVVFIPAFLLLPRNSILRKWWWCTLTGSLVGVAGLWIDALFYALFSSGSSHSLNGPLLMAASIPAAVFGGATCFAATAFEQIANRKNRQTEAVNQRARSSKAVDVATRRQRSTGANANPLNEVQLSGSVRIREIHSTTNSDK